MLVKNKKIKCF